MVKGCRKAVAIIMPQYTYFCNSCEKKIELVLSYAEYEKNKIRCNNCGSLKVTRSFSDDMICISSCIKKHDSELKTIGDLANRNNDKFSEDKKASLRNKHNEYKEDTSYQKELPSGMSRIKKPRKNT